jgi:uncharacterized membrane protein YjfL (UPF0719 family)
MDWIASQMSVVAAQVLPEEGSGSYLLWLMQSLGLVALYGIVGVIVAMIGYKIFDFCTPGDMHKEIVENRNVAAAIVAASVILGVCIIVAASILG